MVDVSALQKISSTFLLPDSDSVDFPVIQRRLSVDMDRLGAESRCYAWLVLLRVFPIDPVSWPSTLSVLVSEYEGYLDDLCLTDHLTKLVPLEQAHFNFGVSNNSLMELIHSDIARTGHHIYCLPALPISGDPSTDPLMAFTGHLRKMERILYTLGMVNRALGYNQGFNELLQPFYLLLFSVKQLFQGSEIAIECLGFQMLLRLLHETRLRKLFVVGISSNSIITELAEFSKLFEKFLPQIASHLNTLDVQPICYCYRWFSLLFAQEFEMPNVVMIWDRLLVHVSDLVRYLFLIGLGFLKCWEQEIAWMDAPMFLSWCQALKPQDIPSALTYADTIWPQLDL
jgi:hypothetical protein